MPLHSRWSILQRGCKGAHSIFGMRVLKSSVLAGSGACDVDTAPKAVSLNATLPISMLQTPKITMPNPTNSPSSSTSSDTFSSDQASPPHNIAALIYHNLETALKNEYARRFDADVILRRTGDSDDASEITMRVEYKGLSDLSAELDVTHAGGETYDVHCTVQGGADRRLSYSVPKDMATQLSQGPHLGQKLATFLLEELEKRLERLVLDAPGGALGIEA